MKTITNITNDSDLPIFVQNEISKLLKAGFLREHLSISTSGEVFFDTELSDFEDMKKAESPELPRESYMQILYPPYIEIADHSD